MPVGSRLFCVLMLMVIPGFALTQTQVKSIGTPLVTNYDISHIPAGTQTWKVDIAASGLVYYANNDGVLEFDGSKWRLYQLPHKTVARSIKASPDGKIYVGGHNEMGYFLPDPTGKMVFHSMHDKLPDIHRDFGDVWKIYLFKEKVVFQTFTHLMIFHQDDFEIIMPPEMFHFSYLLDDRLILVDQSQGIFVLTDDHILERLHGTEVLNGKFVWAILPKGDNLLFATADEGLYEFDGERLTPWVNPVATRLMQNQVFCGLAISNNTYAFGTIQDGLFISDTAGNLIQHINIDKGLQNNTVLSIKLDQFNNLWLGLDNGIDYVEINSPLTFFSTPHNLSSAYAAIVHNGLLYVGTNRGVFYYEWDRLQHGDSEQKFNLVPGTQGQVWSLQVIDETLFCGHNSGVFIIEGTQANMISNVQGGWTFLQPEKRDDIVLCGTYTYLLKFRKVNGSWMPGEPLKGFKESSRYMVNACDNSVWISHGYKGVYRVYFDEAFDHVEKFEFFNSAHGFPSDKDISVHEVMGRPVFTTGLGLFKFNADLNAFEPDAYLSNRLTKSDMIQMQEDQDGNLWFFTQTDAGVYRLLEDGNFSLVDLPFRELSGKFIKWFQFVYPYDDNNILIGTQNGFAHYNPAFAKNYQKPFKAFIRSMTVLAGVDSTLFAGSDPGPDFHAEIPYRFNELQFEFAANDFENADGIRYFVKLEGFDKSWIDWQNQKIRQFTNLEHGAYTFKVKAVNIFDKETEEAALSFTILPPWYLTPYAYVGYAIIILLLFGSILQYMRLRFERSKKRFEEEQKKTFKERERQLQIETLEAEKELIRLRNEKLQLEKIQKDKELANTTMQIIQKSKSLSSIKSELRKLRRDLDQHPALGQINLLIKRINRSIDTDNQWEVFESHFENVHEEFLKRLKENYPDLTPRELKLCAYLRLNISSKEIANLMNISVRGVEISRYRLRKKLGLGHDQNLTDFILSFNDK